MFRWFFYDILPVILSIGDTWRRCDPVFSRCDSPSARIAAAKIILSENQYDAEIEVLEGDTANAVLQHAENIGADLVITGTRDQNRLSMYGL